MPLIPRNANLPQGLSLLRQLNARADAKTLNLGLGKPEEDMPLILRQLASEALSESTRLDYTENAGDAGLRDILAKRFRISNGKKMVLTHGAQEALMAAMIATLNRGDEVLIPDPGFLAYPVMVRMLGAKPVFYPLKRVHDAYVHDVQAITERITSRTRMILVSSPGNPTGCDLPPETLRELLAQIGRRKITVLSDEVYGMLHFSRPYLPFACEDERVISVSSFSKSHALTGWRIGFLACENNELLQSCLIAHQYIATCASVPAQRLLAKLFEGKTPGLSLFDQIAEDYRERYRAKLELFLSSASDDLRSRTPRAWGAFYLFPRLKKEKSSLKFCERLLAEKNVLAVPGSVFGKKGEGSVRLSLALPDKKIVDAARVLSLHF